jgi:hypothetical protein
MYRMASVAAIFQGLMQGPPMAANIKAAAASAFMLEFDPAISIQKFLYLGGEQLKDSP